MHDHSVVSWDRAQGSEVGTKWSRTGDARRRSLLFGFADHEPHPILENQCVADADRLIRFDDSLGAIGEREFVESIYRLEVVVPRRAERFFRQRS